MPITIVELAILFDDLEETGGAVAYAGVLAQEVGLPLVFCWQRGERKLDGRIPRGKGAADGNQLALQTVLHGPRQLLSIFFAQLNLASWQRVGVSAAAHEEEGLRSGMILFERCLREPRVIAAPPMELQGRVVAGI